MSLIRRPITGGGGLGLAFAVAGAPGTALHALDNTGTGLGGPFPQRVTLFVQNPTGGALTMTIALPNGVSVAKQLASGEIWNPFDSQPMQQVSSSSLTITGTGSAPGLVAWGFVETQT